MEVVPISPRGYCYGVVDALKLARAVARDPSSRRPIYVLGMLVHNRHAVFELESLGIRTLDGADRLALLERVDSGTVILTAHGVSPEVKARALQRGLSVVDATCADVTRTHELVRRLAGEGYYIVYIGRAGHPEAEGVLGEQPGCITLIEREDEVDSLAVPKGRPLAVTTQTTLSQWDTEAIISRIRARFPAVRVFNEICMATQLRQQAAVREAASVDVVIVVGDPRSHNSTRLVQVVRERARKPAYLVEDPSQIRPEWLAEARRVGVTAGSSTPSPITRAVIRWLRDYPAGLPRPDRGSAGETPVSDRTERGSRTWST